MELKSLNELFEKKVFRIPKYQRGYAWDDLQIDEFWEDLYNLLPEKVHYTGMISIKKLNSSETTDWQNINFLFCKKYIPYHIVDGQQRITTMIILINEIVNYFRKRNPEKNDDQIKIYNMTLKEIVNKYLFQEDSIIEEKNYFFGYEKDNPSNEFFKHRIMDEPNEGTIEETFYTSKLKNVREKINKKLVSLVENEGDECLKVIFNKLTNFFKFNIYEIGDEYDVYMAFETMNNRGKQLSYLERLKNRLFYLITLYKDEEIVEIKEKADKNTKELVDRKRNDIGNEINETWKTVYYYLGKDNENLLSDNDYLQTHWMIYFPYNRTGQDAYKKYLFNTYFIQGRILSDSIINTIYEYEEYQDEDSVFDSVEKEKNIDNKIYEDKLKITDIKKYINSLKNLVKYYYFMLNPSDSDFKGQNIEIIKYLTRLNNLGFSSFKPLITVILAADNIEDEQKIKALKLMERYIFIEHRLCGTLSNYKNSTFYKLARELYYKDISIDHVLSELNNVDSLGINNVINTDLVIPRSEKLFARGKDGFYHWNCLKFILTEYEMYLTKGKGAEKINRNYLFKIPEEDKEKFKDKYSIEHIYPQTASNEYWTKRFSSLDKDEQIRLNGSLGNLLPLSMAINRDYQNDSFPDKKNGTHRLDDNKEHRGYKNGTYSEQEVSHNREWNPQKILERGLKIIKFMEEEWNFHFENLYVKKQFLGLKFLAEEKDKNKKVYKFISKNNDDEKIKTKSLKEELFIVINDKKYGSGFYKNGGILVKKGTKIRTDEHSVTKSISEIIKIERKNDKIINNEYTEDVFYESPSRAAYIILGNNQNGWSIWKNKEGKSLDELVRKK